MSALRTISFTSWDDVDQNLARLLKGYTQQGNWNLSQIVLHLNDWLSFAMDGYPRPPLPVRFIMALMRWTIGPGMLRKTLKSGFQPGTPTLPLTVHAESESSDQAAVERFRKTIDRFRNYSSPLHPSPLYGRMDHRTAENLHLIHAAHHLRFLTPST